MTLAIAGGLVLIFGIAVIVYAIGFYLERAEHQDTKTALETCRESHRRARSEADDLQRKVWGHPAELTKAKQDGRQKLAEEIRDAKVGAADAAIKGMDGRLAALDELRETGAIDKKTFEARGKKLREQIEALESDKRMARVVARYRAGDGSFSHLSINWP